MHENKNKILKRFIFFSPSVDGGTIPEVIGSEATSEATTRSIPQGISFLLRGWVLDLRLRVALTPDVCAPLPTSRALRVTHH